MLYSNPNVGPEAKAHAEQVLADAGESTSANTSGGQAKTGGDEHDNRVLGGYKATLSNPNTGEEAKEHAKEVLANAGVSTESSDNTGTSGQTGSSGSNDDSELSTHDKNVLAGYKGVLASKFNPLSDTFLY